uniref:Major facilitator superfamily (MFS) profile domain-containing protein n=1 Tax=Timema shepardi TaxID=629360 RepID=A0A7R9G134_TIMSH|nr:unnamed protein product [Timema shepardi]
MEPGLTNSTVMEPGAEKKNGKETVDFETAIALTGQGRFHYRLMFGCGFCLVAMVCELYGTSYLLPAAQCDFQMSAQEKGLLNSIGLIGGGRMVGVGESRGEELSTLGDPGAECWRSESLLSVSLAGAAGVSHPVGSPLEGTIRLEGGSPGNTESRWEVKEQSRQHEVVVGGEGTVPATEKGASNWFGKTRVLLAGKRTNRNKGVDHRGKSVTDGSVNMDRERSRQKGSGGWSGRCVISSSHLWGYLADTKGRRKILMVTLAMDAVCAVISCFAPTFYIYLVVRYFCGFFVCGPSAIVYAYIGEFHAAPTRARAIVFVSVVVSIASIGQPGECVNGNHITS